MSVSKFEVNVIGLEICNVIKNVLLDTQIYVADSVAKGNYVALSDVNTVVISNKIPEKLRERDEIKALIEEKLNLPYYHSFEIHLLKPNEAKHSFKKWGDLLHIT